MLAPNETTTAEPVSVLGAGDLVSHVYRTASGESASYSFNIFRQNENMSVTQRLRACDLRDIVKLCQVLTFAIMDDGWSTPEIRDALLELNDQLDELTQSWSQASNE